MLDIPDLPAHLHALLGQIPPGRVTTYGALARALGDRVAARWAGSFMLDHDHGPVCPCHRVVTSDGRIGRYVSGSALDKLKRLESEGVRSHGDKVNLAYYGFEGFESERPLARLSALQDGLVGQVALEPLPEDLDVAGVDVSYAGHEGVAAYARCDLQTGRLTWATCVRRPVRFPYITSYLAFRELPLLLALLAEVRAQGKLARAVLVDGTGILHPRGAGIASHLGVLSGAPTVGVIKTLLCGEVRTRALEVGEARPIRHEDRIVGMALKTRAGAKPIYVSPGHRADVPSALAVVRRACRGHKLPEPLHWADRLSRQAARAGDGRQLDLL